MLRAPQPSDRTWPDFDEYSGSDPRLDAIIRRTLTSEALEQALPFFDWHKVQQMGEGWLDRTNGGGILLGSLVTLDQFLERSR